MNDRVPKFLLSKAEPPAPRAHSRIRRPFIDRALNRIGSVITVTFVQWELASKKGLLQSVDARVKVVCMLFLAVAATLKNDLAALFALGCFLVLLAALSRIALGFFLRRVCVLAVLFGVLVGLPAAFNLVTPGRVVLPIVAFDGPVRIGPFALPAAIGITAEGLTIVARLFLRVADCLCASFLLLYTTPLSQIIRSLKVFRVPDAVVLVLFLAYKYIFLFSKMLEDMYLAARSRLAGSFSMKEARDWSAGRGAVLFRKTQERCEDVFQAMTARGLNKGIVLADSCALKAADIGAGLGLAVAGGLLLWL